MKKTTENIIRLLFVLVFLFSAITKLLDFNNTIYLINGFLGLGYSITKYALLLLIVLEIVIALVFITDYWKKKIILIPTLLLLIGFISLNVFMMLKCFSNCGCFGTVIESNPLISLIKNLFLFVFLISVKNTYKLKPADIK